MAKKSQEKNYLRNVKLFGGFFIILGIGFAILFEFDIFAFLFGGFFASIGVVAVAYPRTVKLYVEALLNNFPL